MNLYELDNSKSSRKKIAESGAGISKKKETQFHAKLDTLVHDTFGKRQDEELDEANPHNFDSDVDYYAAQNAPAKPRYRGTQSPGVNPDDEAYFREIFRKKRLAAQQAEQDKAQGVAEGTSKDAWAAGYQAFHDDVTKCPYTPGSEEASQWNLGWESAQARGWNKEGVAEASPETTFNVLKGLKSWQVVIKNNYYRGKYSDYSGRYYYVLASSPEEAQQVVLNNADGILQELLAMKSHNGKKILPRGSALRITPERIGDIKDGTEAGRMSTAGYKRMFGPEGVMMVKLSGGAVVDVQGQEQGVTEVSKATLDRYVPAAVTAHGHADFSARMSKDDPTKRSYHKDQAHTAEKRRQGISRALDRMSKEDTGLSELSNELLGRYKKELGVRASAADKAGDYDKGHELFKKINKATIRQGENDARKHEQENQNEMMETRLNMMRKAGYDL